MFRLYADKNKLTVREREPLTSGSVNVCPIRFAFSADWNGLERTAVFRAGGESRSVLLDESGACSIPWEVLVKPYAVLEAGVYGTRGSDTVLPTVWASLGTIHSGALPGEDTREPTPGVYDRILDELSGIREQLEGVGGAAGGGDGGYRFGHGLKLTGSVVSVNAVDDFQGDNTLPMTAAGVQTAIGNIETLLGTI